LYALGMDAVGNGLGIEKGAEYLRKGFTEDCVFEIIWPDGSSTDETIGPDAWAAFAAQAFEGTYTNTNHLMGTYDIEVKGNTATMSTHLNATHVRYDGSVDYAEGVYYDDCVRVGGGWKSYHRALHFISFNNFIPEFSLIPPPPEP